ncbi:senescence-specific cysteine protease SAG39-like [Argentina anserina]|uniref:senescence-specific cysteine protease SAG39-like n=1 Tax=Argentina anserina TaxID=57926 RepID=UPI0021764395|nr:senescence-specific cysteine protease SAG39-like [Potentilla anserina]XP_050367902.1 senescence-specific cysteine protease SAG39-like [Potentilla anserina]XP_050367903.1 senescence-specific cysteine protease SAG39-like [Potentilla anserina]
MAFHAYLMKKTLVILCVFLMGSSAVSKATPLTLISEGNDSVNVSRVFENWMEEHGRTYSSGEEKAKRFAIFKENLDYIEDFNSQGNHSFALALNAFSDMTCAELLKPSSSFRYQDFKLEDLPPNWDWRTQGAVTNVKDQKDCDCGWAFATAAAVEGLTPFYNKPYGKLMNLSEKELITCTKPSWIKGIASYISQIKEAMSYARDHGLITEEKHPYRVADNQSCPDMKISGYEVVPEFDEVALAKAVYHQPVVVVHSTSKRFRAHRGGIFMDADGKCGRGNINHTSTLVGFGTTALGQDYWILKNSWGTHWGEHGYARIRRNTRDKRGVCNLATFAVFPTL